MSQTVDNAVRGNRSSTKPAASDSFRHYSVREIIAQRNNPRIFYNELLHNQGKSWGACYGAIVSYTPAEGGKILGIYPQMQVVDSIPYWLQKVLQCLLKSEDPESIHSLLLKNQDTSASLHAVVDHIDRVEQVQDDGSRRAVVFCFEQRAPNNYQAALEQIILAIELNDILLQQASESRRQFVAKGVIEIMADFNRARHFKEAALLLCNSIAVKMQFEKVCLGIWKDSKCKLVAMSDMGNFEKKMPFNRRITQAMEESCQQNIEILYPQSLGSPVISSAAAELNRQHGPCNIITMPIREAGEPVAVFTIITLPEKEVTESIFETVRLSSELVSARLVELKNRDRWFGAKVWDAIMRDGRFVLGPTHTLYKIIGLVVFAAAIFFSFAQGDYEVESSFVLSATQKCVVAAPYDTFLTEVNVKPGDYVKKDNTVLGQLEVIDKKLEKTAMQAEYIGYVKESVLALQEGDTAKAQIAKAKAKESLAKVSLLNYQIKQTRLMATGTGYISSKDIKLGIGAPVKRGDVLFEILLSNELEADIYVPEEDISEIREGMGGELAVMGYPGKKVTFEVVNINPIAEVVKERNTFKVTAKLKERPEWMKPGMEGVSHVNAGRKLLVWMWTRKAINWVRIKVWI